jgi:radical SAM protein with 4Fe4S-binding SPASM domain
MAFSHWISKLQAVAGIAHGSRAFSGPLQLNLSLTNRCNLRCIHCYFYSPFLDLPNMRPLRLARQEGAPDLGRKDLEKLQRIDADLDRVTVILDEALAMGTRRVQFSGNGECFMHKNALYLMRRARDAGAHCVANTNGTLIDRAAADELIRMRFDELRVTLMAGTREMYQRTHPGTRDDMFDRVHGNLLYLKERKRALGVDRPVVKTVYIVVDQNCDGLLDFAKRSIELGAQAVLYKPVDDLGDESMRPLVPTPKHADLAKRQLAEARAILEKAGVKHNADGFLRAFGGHLDTTALYDEIPCYYGWLACMIEPDGQVYGCCRCYEPLGNAYATSFSAVWNSERYRQFRSEAGRLNRGGKPNHCCECDRCVHHEANFNAFKMLHPWKARKAAAALRFPGVGE